MLSAKDYVVAKVLLCWILLTTNTIQISQMLVMSYRLVEVTVQVSESVKYLLDSYVTVLVCKRCHNEFPQPGGFKQRKLMLSEFKRRPEV